MNKCTNCGNEFEGKFCPNCGQKFEIENKELPEIDPLITEILNKGFEETWEKENKKPYAINLAISFIGISSYLAGIGLFIYSIVLSIQNFNNNSTFNFEILTNLLDKSFYPAIVLFVLADIFINLDHYLEVRNFCLWVNKHNINLKMLIKKEKDYALISRDINKIKKTAYCIDSSFIVDKMKNHIILISFLYTIAIILSSIILYQAVIYELILRIFLTQSSANTLIIVYTIIVLIPMLIARGISSLSKPLKAKKLSQWEEQQK